MTAFKYLIYDIESVTNKALLNKVLFASENYSDEEAFKTHQAELAEEGRDFINPAFHQPVSIAAIAVQEDFSISKIGVLGGDKPTTGSIVKAFWDIYNKQKPTLVDFNGKGYDIRLMELWAFQMGISIHPRHFAKFGSRYRYNEEAHLDLHEFLTNHLSIRLRGGLNLFAKLLGKPGKMETKGDQVQELYDQGKQFEIDDYCLCDAMDTYFVFLRTRVMMGQLTLDKEHELVVAAKEALLEKNKQEGYFKAYLENFGEWKAVE